MTPLLRLLRITDSAFPIGGYAYSHGLEWLAAQNLVHDEGTLAQLLDGYIAQSIGRQSLPACRRAHQARSLAAIIRADHELDAAIAPPSEREAGRAMGERLLTESTSLPTPPLPVLPRKEERGPGSEGLGRSEDHSQGPARSPELLAAVHANHSRGQFAVAFGTVTRDLGIALEDSLSALGYSLANSVVQAGVRLGVVGSAAAVRVMARATPAIVRAVERESRATGNRLPGAFTPGLDAAGLLHPTLPFRMFAS